MKNKLNFYSLLLVGMTLLIFSACSDPADLNIDPNNPAEVPASAIVTQAQYRLADQVWRRSFNAEWAMLMVQHWAQNEYAEESRFVVDVTSFDNDWIRFYASIIKEFDEAARLISEDDGIPADLQTNQLAITEIMSVFAYHNLTDAFGDVPYFETLDPIANPNPAYDDQEAIYKDLATRLQTALGTIKASSGSFGGAELIYGGDMSMWSKFGNSLLMRIAMRMVDADPTTASGIISSISPDQMISSNDENAIFNFDSNPSVANPLYIDNTINNRDDFCVSEELVERLKAMNDPRLSAYADENASGEFVGMPSGLLDNDATELKPNCSRPDASVRTATAPAVLMDYAEVSFLLAEAYQRGILTGDAAAAYDQGVTASMEYWGITDADALADYLAANAYDAENWKESIGTQKWLAFYMNGPQAWAEWRRLDYPVLEVPEAAVQDEIPVRLPYPLSETTSNASFDAADPNDVMTKMWWDMN